MTLEELNALPPDAAEARLLTCCHAVRWAREMAARRPFADRDALLRAADDAWSALAPAEWEEAFAAHPRIGERAPAPVQTEREAAWSRQEQSAAALASADVSAALADGNREYEARFGRTYIVCATGKSAEEMLAILRARLGNDADTELRAAAAEQARITRIRLEKLLAE